MIDRFDLQYLVKNNLRDEARILKRLCDPAKVSVDAGANLGVFTLFLSKYSRSVCCYEPVPWLADRLRDRFLASNVTVESCALGDVEEEMTLRIPLVGDFSDASIVGKPVTQVEEVGVQVRRLDTFALKDVGFVKIDVEGYEMELLRGAETTLKENMPNMYIETEQRHLKGRSVQDVFRVLQNLGYHGYFVRHGRLRRIDEFDARSMQDPAREKTPDYTNDFIFYPSGDLKIDL